MKKTIKLTGFDAELNTDCCDATTNADLTIILKLGFRQVNPAGGAAAGTYHDYGDASEPERKIVKWEDGPWAAWKRNFVSSAQDFWHGKFWLLNNRGIMPYDVGGGKIYIPNVWCRFSLIGSDADVGLHHHVIDVVRLDPTETWFGSHSTLYDNLDTNASDKGADNEGNTIMQRAHVHEIGHLLGMEHVDVGTATCPANGDTNASACYGTSDASLYDVMGRGETLHTRHAAPWLRALSRFLPLIPTSTLYMPPPANVSRFTAYMRRCYPRTTAEYEAGKPIYSRK